MIKLGSHYVDTPMTFGDVPEGFRFAYQGFLYRKMISVPCINSRKLPNVIKCETGQICWISDNVQVEGLLNV
jgi:hypothetical protein